MNAAFLLVTATWLAGDTPAAQAPKTDQPIRADQPVAAAPYHAGSVVSAPYAGGCGSCGSSCDACCEESWGSKFRGRLHGLFHKNDCCDSCSTCAPAPSCNTCNTCDSGWKSKWRGWWNRDDCCDHGHASCGACATSCDSCDSGGLLARLRAKFHKHDCCDSCNTCGGCGSAPVYGAPAVPAAGKPEQIGQPQLKKMPEAPGK